MRALLLTIIITALPAFAADQQAPTLAADGFDFPVGKPDGEGYYKARGYRPNGHLGEDWNGRGGGDTDLGAPVTACANGAVVFAENFRHGWGNVVIIRHVYEEGGVSKFVDSLYGHLDQILTRYGQHVRRGQQIGTVGTGGGLYAAHLHFEIRKDLRVGMARHRFPHDDQVYWNPTDFVNAHRKLAVSAPTAMIPIHTFVKFEVVDLKDDTSGPSLVLPGGNKPAAPVKNPDWKPQRYEDVKPKR
jgi:murein DD-endopeptidase MepM/ murein hydrolase activator NlpD